jgi:hypothetical protein
MQKKYGKAIFQRTNAPTQGELAQFVHTISHRVARYLERQGILERDEESSYLQHRNAINWKAVSIYFKTSCFGKTPVADIGWQHPLPAKDSLS